MISAPSVRALGVTAVVMLMSLGIAQAQTQLIFASQSPAGTENGRFYGSIAKKITDDSNGALNVVLREGETIANVANAYDRVQNDVIQIGWVLHSLVGKRFPRTEVSGLPFIGTSNVACSIATWKLYESGLIKVEYEDVIPIWFGCLGTSYLHWAKTPANLDTILGTADLAGAKFRVNGRLPGEMIKLVGANPTSMAPSEMYEGLQRGTINGVVTSWAGFDPYKLAEVTAYHLEVPIASTPSMHFMSRKKFESLPKAAQDAIMKSGGLEGSIRMGKYIDEVANKAREGVLKIGQPVVKLTPDQYKVWEKKALPIKEDWAKSVPDGDKVLAAFAKFFREAEAAGN